MIYLDNAATTMPKPPVVVKCTALALSTLSSPGRGSGSMSKRAEEVLYRLRNEAGELFSWDPRKVVLTTSATHGLNIAFRSLVKPGDRVVTSCMEHNAVMRPLHALGANIQIATARLFDDETLVGEFDRLLTKDTSLCVMTHVSNVFGWILPVYRVAELCQKRGIPFVLDASQSAGVLDVDGEKLHPAFIAMPGHKGLLGPSGTGLLLAGERTAPILFGGTGSRSKELQMPDSLPDRLEAGTHNMPGAAGLLAGIRYVRKNRERINSREQELKELLIRGMIKLDGVKCFWGENQAGVISFLPEHGDPVSLAEALSEKYDIALRAGLHCAPEAHLAAGTLETGTVRVSFGPFNRQEHVSMLLHALRAELRNDKDS